MPWPIDPALWGHADEVRELKFTREEYDARVERVREQVRERGLDAFVCHLHPSILYLTGLQTSSFWTWYALVIPAEGDLVVLSDEADVHNGLVSSWLEPEQAYAYAFSGADPAAETAELLRGLGYAGKRIGLEGDSIVMVAELGSSHGVRTRLKAGLDAQWEDVDGLVETLMAVKSPAEIECFRRAAELSRIGFRALIDAVAPGTLDTELAAAIYHAVYSAGGEPFVIEPLMSVGAKSGIFHAKWNRTALEPGDAIFCEIGGCWHRYSSPMMRTIVLEPGPADDHRTMIEACRDAVQLTIDGMRPGVVGSELAETASAPIRALPDHIVKDGNRAYSLEAGDIMWSAWPGFVSDRLTDTVLEAGQIYHVRGAVRKVGRYGATMSETVLVTDDGAEVLTGELPTEIVV